MRRINVKEVTPELLASLNEPVRFVDDDGKIVGYYEPQPEPADWERYLDELPPEEWERRVKAGGRPLAEYLAEIDLR